MAKPSFDVDALIGAIFKAVRQGEVAQLHTSFGVEDRIILTVSPYSSYAGFHKEGGGAVEAMGTRTDSEAELTFMGLPPFAVSIETRTWTDALKVKYVYQQERIMEIQALRESGLHFSHGLREVLRRAFGDLWGVCFSELAKTHLTDMGSPASENTIVAEDLYLLTFKQSNFIFLRPEPRMRLVK